MNEDHKPKLDGSINIPTLVALIGLLVAQGILPSGDSKAIAEEAVEVHSQVLHAGSVPLQTYELEQAHELAGAEMLLAWAKYVKAREKCAALAVKVEAALAELGK